MSANRKLAWSPGAAGPLLHLAPAADPRDNHWRDFAACDGIDVSQFYPENGWATAAAKRVCARCPVQPQCLEEALSWPAEHDWGVWAGTSRWDRRRIRQERQRAA